MGKVNVAANSTSILMGDRERKTGSQKDAIYASTAAEEAAGVDANEESLPASFYCPLTMCVMKDPVIDHEGNSYERAAITSWLSLNKTSPVTRNHLTSHRLFPNRALKDLIVERMGPKWAEGAVSPMQIPRLTDCQASIAGYLAEIGDAIGRKLELNDRGTGAFAYEKLTFVIDVPRNSTSFYLHSTLFDMKNAQNREKVKEEALRLNFLQSDTRGGCLAVDPFFQVILFSYADRTEEITSDVFRNILANFIDTALSLSNRLRFVSCT